MWFCEILNLPNDEHHLVYDGINEIDDIPEFAHPPCNILRIIK